MGYTHNWYRPQVLPSSTFDAISQDFQKALPALEAAGSSIANAYGLEKPEFTAEHIRFNGVSPCGHSKNPEVRPPWPGNGASGGGDNTGLLSGTLSSRTCNGDCSYESVWFDRCMDEEGRDVDGLCGSFCKTAFRPYDLAVTVFLLIAKHHLGNALRIDTDGEAKQWEAALQLCQAKLGYCMTFEQVIG